jgi:hypothetical protein
MWWLLAIWLLARKQPLLGARGKNYGDVVDHRTGGRGQPDYSKSGGRTITDPKFAKAWASHAAPSEVVQLPDVGPQKFVPDGGGGGGRKPSRGAGIIPTDSPSDFVPDRPGGLPGQGPYPAGGGGGGQPVETSPASQQQDFWDQYGGLEDAYDQYSNPAPDPVGAGHWEKLTVQDRADGLANKNWPRGFKWVPDYDDDDDG